MESNHNLCVLVHYSTGWVKAMSRQAQNALTDQWWETHPLMNMNKILKSLVVLFFILGIVIWNK